MKSISLKLGMLPAVLACGLVVGCSAADDPKMPDVPPSTAKPETAVPKVVGPGKEPYGSNKKYQDSMNK